MPLHFNKIPSEIEIPLAKPDEPTVGDELEFCRQLLEQRTTKCARIPPVYKRPKKKPLRYAYKHFCICPRYKPHYCCKHTGNIIIDRDVLTKEEHICHLATPRENVAAQRKQPRFLHKRVVVPDCTSRIEQLALPKLKHVEDTLANYKSVLSSKQYDLLKKYLAKKNSVNHTSIQMALSFIEEERRLERTAKALQKQRCKRFKKTILREQRKQIKQIICVIFEEMRDFLLNDQFLFEERTTLSSAILEQIRKFTDKEFFTSSNLGEYQQVLASNISVWINQFISKMNIHVAKPMKKIDPIEPEPFLPVTDYISCSETVEDEGDHYNDYEFYGYRESELEHEQEVDTALGPPTGN